MVKKIGETVAHRIYGPYQTGTKIAWWVIPAYGKKRVFKSKFKMLEFIDTITTDLSKKKRND